MWLKIKSTNIPLLKNYFNFSSLKFLLFIKLLFQLLILLLFYNIIIGKTEVIMNDVNVFLNCEIKDTSFLQYIGDRCLAPTRYFFHGRTVEILTNQHAQLTGVHHVASYHKAGVDHKSRTNDQLFSDSFSMGKTVFMIMALIPGFIFGMIIKGLDYAMSVPMKMRHQIAIQHFISRDLEAGGNNRDEIIAAIRQQAQHPYHVKVRALTIRGPAGVSLDENIPDLHLLNPQKLILVGPRIGHPAGTNGDRLDDVLAATHKWAVALTRPHERPMHQTLVAQKQVSSIDEALDDFPERRTLFKRYHQVYNVI